MDDFAQHNAEIVRLRKVLEAIAEFCSGDLTTLGSIARLASIQNEARNALGVVGTPREQT
jgi:alkylated DNA nucleotide flippase Atl1